MSSSLAVIALLLLAAGASTATAEIFTNTFLVRMRQPAERHVADRVAHRNGFVNLGPVSRGELPSAVDRPAPIENAISFVKE